MLFLKEVGLGLSIVLSIASPTFAGDFQHYYKTNNNQELVFSAHQIQKAKSLHYVLIPGLFGHFSNLKHSLPLAFQWKPVFDAFDRVNPTYFEELGEVVKQELGAPFSILYRNPFHSFEENSDFFSTELQRIYRKHGGEKKLVLIGHSKGGLDAVFTPLHHPELAEMVEYVLAVQSPFMGAKGARDVKTSVLAKYCNSCLERIDEIAHDKIQNIFWNKLREMTEDQKRTASMKIGYLGSYVRNKGDVTWMTYGLHDSIRSDLAEEKSDGLIRSRDQVLAFNQDHLSPEDLAPEIGNLWGFLEGIDHCELFIGQGLLQMKKTYLTPKAYFYDLPSDMLRARNKRLDLGRRILSYQLEVSGHADQ